MTPHNLRVGWKRCGLEPVDRELALKVDIMEKNQVYSKQTEFSSVVYFIVVLNNFYWKNLMLNSRYTHINVQVLKQVLK